MRSAPPWFESNRPPGSPSLAGDIAVDVAVVGGGITGITAARLLGNEGLKVALIERGECGRQDSGRSSAHLTAVPDERWHTLGQRLGRERAFSVWSAGTAAIARIFDLAARDRISCSLRRVDGFLHGTSAADREEMSAESKAARDMGIRASFEPAVPIFGTPGVRFPDQAMIHPLKYLRGLLRRLPDLNCHVFENTQVREITAKPLCVHTAAGRISCHNLVLATHGPTVGTGSGSSWLPFRTKLTRLTTFALSGRLPAGTCPEGIFWDNLEPYHYLRVEHQRRCDQVIFGGGDRRAGSLDDPSAPFDRLEGKLRERWPEFRSDHRWSGQVLQTSDGLPFLGETEPGIFVATGFGGNGLTFGTAAATMATDAVLRRPNPWRPLFDPARRGIGSPGGGDSDHPFAPGSAHAFHCR